LKALTRPGLSLSVAAALIKPTAKLAAVFGQGQAEHPAQGAPCRYSKVKQIKELNGRMIAEADEAAFGMSLAKHNVDGTEPFRR
jgi:hypothetical protein